MQVSFLIVDDHPLFREALQAAIGTAFPGSHIEEASSISAAKDAIAAHSRFDVVLLDLSMPGTTGFDGLLELRSLAPKQPIVVVSALEDPRIIHEAMTCGAAAFISKSIRKSELAKAIEEVMAGAIYLPPSYTPPSANGSDQPDLAHRLASLTPQQLRVLQMVRQGKLNKQIAYELDVGETTVKAHVSEILRKLNVASRTQAVIEAGRIDFNTILSKSGADKTGKPRPAR
jgi:DNA-binding NarL/FixJ family response regulator